MKLSRIENIGITAKNFSREIVALEDEKRRGLEMLTDGIKDIEKDVNTSKYMDNLKNIGDDAKIEDVMTEKPLNKSGEFARLSMIEKINNKSKSEHLKMIEVMKQNDRK